MLFLKYNILLSIVFVKSYADDIVSEEAREQNNRKDKNTYSKVERRFFDFTDDETWHVAHLKDTDFSARKSGCAEDTFEEKVKKYRKSLRNDGALVEYVSADALPFNETDLETEVCKAPDKKAVLQIAPKKKSQTDGPKQAATPFSKSEVLKAEINENDAKTKIRDQDKQESLNVATTTTEKAKEPSDEPPNARKASEYQFSSIEYYEETIDFDASICPDDVDVVILELEHIRNYDVKCEQLLEWRSLE